MKFRILLYTPHLYHGCFRLIPVMD